MKQYLLICHSKDTIWQKTVLIKKPEKVHFCDLQYMWWYDILDTKISHECLTTARKDRQEGEQNDQKADLKEILFYWLIHDVDMNLF